MFEAGAALPTALRDQLDAGRLMIPLSSVTCEELTEIPRDQFREPMADVMWRLSKDATIARRPRSWTRSTGGHSADFSGERAGVRPRRRLRLRHGFATRIADLAEGGLRV